MEGAEFAALSPVFGVAEFQTVSWIVCLGIVAAWMQGFALGGNGAANDFSTTVGAGVMTLKQAMGTAAIFDCAGALTLGVGVSKTIASKIADVNHFSTIPTLYMLGMLSASLGAVVCVSTAARMGIPISSTHATVGAVLGFAWIEQHDAIVWWTPGNVGMGAIAISWVLSPLLSGTIASILYLLTKRFCLDVVPLDTAFHRHRIIASVITAWTLALIALFIGYDVAHRTGGQDGWHAAIVASAVFVVVGFFSYCAIFPWHSSRLARRRYVGDFSISDKKSSKVLKFFGGGGGGGNPSNEDSPLLHMKDFGDYTENPAYEGPTYMAGAEPYDRRDYHNIETTSSHLQATAIESRFDSLVAITACFMSYTHGANGISNAAGPLLAIWDTFSKGRVDYNVNTFYWVSCVGLFGVCVGLAVWGSHVVRTVGKKLTQDMTAPKAFAMNFGAASAVLVASYLKLPVSNTHCMIGAVVAVGRCEGTGNVQWKLVLKIFASWIITVPFSASVAAAVYSILKPLVTGVSISNGALLMSCVGPACPGLVNASNNASAALLHAFAAPLR